jgi:hypothetical protein
MTDSARPALTFRHWLIIIIASIGFLFDTYELLMTPLVGVPAIAELLNLPPNNPVVTEWIGKLQWMSAACGGVFGLLGGWLIDRFGRKRIMAASIFLYAFSPFAAAFAKTLGAFLFFRCTTFIGVCVEFVAAITWLAEMFPDRKQKEWVLGSTQAFASLGGILVTAVNAWIVANAGKLPALHLPEIFDAHATWRYALMTGLLPAIPIALMLPFVPESQVWREKRAAGTLKRPSFGELFSPALCRVTLVTALLSACAYAAAFGALQLTPLRIAPGLPELTEQRKQMKPLADEATALNQQLLQVRPDFELAIKQVSGLEDLAALRAKNRKAFRAANKVGDKDKVAALAAEFKTLGVRLDELTASNPQAKKAIVEREKVLKALGDNREKVEPLDKQVKERGNTVQLKQEIGGLVGRIILAILVVTAIARRTLLQLFIIPGLVVLPLAYFNLYHTGGSTFDWSIFFCGMLIVGQFSYFGEYLPKVFPLHLRGTGGSFATNVGGRMIGTSAAFLTTNIIAPKMAGANTFDKVALAAAIVGTAVLVIALVVSFFLPEPPAETLD